MNKAQFSRAVKAMLVSITSIPDELWTSGFPTVSVRLGSMEAYIGLRPVVYNGVHRGEDTDED